MDEVRDTAMSKLRLWKDGHMSEHEAGRDLDALVAEKQSDLKRCNAL